MSCTNALYPGLKGRSSGGRVYTNAKLLDGKKKNLWCINLLWSLASSHREDELDLP